MLTGSMKLEKCENRLISVMDGNEAAANKNIMRPGIG
jgi:hypothetical protein